MNWCVLPIFGGATWIFSFFRSIFWDSVRNITTFTKPFFRRKRGHFKFELEFPRPKDENGTSLFALVAVWQYDLKKIKDASAVLLLTGYEGDNRNCTLAETGADCKWPAASRCVPGATYSFTPTLKVWPFSRALLRKWCTSICHFYLYIIYIYMKFARTTQSLGPSGVTVTVTVLVILSLRP